MDYFLQEYFPLLIHVWYQTVNQMIVSLFLLGDPNLYSCAFYSNYLVSLSSLLGTIIWSCFSRKMCQCSSSYTAIQTERISYFLIF